MIERFLAMLSVDIGDPSCIEQLYENSWRISLEDELDIDIKYEENFIKMSSYLGLLEKNKSFLLDTLSGNCLGAGTFGSAICSENGEKLYIKREDIDSIPYRDFFSRLEELATATNFWRKHLEIR